MNITYRPATPDDFDFLFQMHEATMREYVEATYGPWEETFQREYYRKAYKPDEQYIIQMDEGGAYKDVGMLVIQDRTEEIFLIAIEILPAYQRQGIGSAVIRGLVEHAAARSKPVALKVMKANPAARGLYQRLGFGVTGQTGTHYIMACHG